MSGFGSKKLDAAYDRWATKSPDDDFDDEDEEDVDEDEEDDVE